MAGKNYKKLIIGFGCLAVFLLTASCASVPKAETFYRDRSGFSLMPEGAPLYLMAEVQEVRPILDELVLGGLSGAEIKKFLDMSNHVTLAVYQNPGERHFYAAAMGKFPSGGGGLFFSASKDWEKKVSASGLPYWYSERSWLSVSLGAKEAYLSDVDPFVSPPGAKIPEALPAMQKDSVLSGWMNNPAQAIKKLAAAFEIPIEIPAERFLFVIYPADESTSGGGSKKNRADENSLYSATLRFETPAAAQAAGLVMIFSLARLGMANADFGDHKKMETLARAFFSNSPRQDGNALILKTGVMSGKDLALLFNTISVY